MHKRLIVEGYWGPTDPILQVLGPEPITHQLTTQLGTIDGLGDPCMASSAPAHQTTPSQPNSQCIYLCRRHGPGPKGLGLWALRDMGGALGGYWRCWGGIGGVIGMSMAR